MHKETHEQLAVRYGSGEDAVSEIRCAMRRQLESNAVNGSGRWRELDFQNMTDQLSVANAILSVEKREGGYGEIRIVASNQVYKDIMGPAYYDNMPYHELVPKDAKFEDFCYRSAMLKQHMHAYVETAGLHCWTDQNMFPLEYEDDECAYCQFFFEFTPEADPERMSKVSANTAAIVIQSAITLLQSGDFKSNVGTVLESIMEASGANGCRIMLIDREKETAEIFADRIWDSNGISEPEEHVFIPYDVVDSWEAMIGVSNAVIIKDEHDMDSVAERNAAWAESLRQHNVRSVVLCPFRRSRDVFGYLYIVNFDVDKVVEVKELVELMSFFLSSEVLNYQLLKRLEFLGKTDMLTGLLNRHALLPRVERIHDASPAPFGVVSLDLNGLKATNDALGHDAGDRLLIRASEILQAVFDHEDVFRTGGDEFIAIISGVPQEEFDRKLDELHGIMDESDAVRFAIGSFWADGATATKTAFLQADALMYEDKKRYYDSHPELRRY